MIRIYDSQDLELVQKRVEFGDELAPALRDCGTAFDRAEFVARHLAHGLRQVEEIEDEYPELEF